MGARGRLKIGVLGLLFLLAMFLPAVACAEGMSYYYDSSGRLHKALREDGSAALYRYDDAGNLLSIENLQIDKAPPEIDSLNPKIFFTGTPSIVITMKGRNLFTLEGLYTDNAGVHILGFQSTEDTITAEIGIDSDAPSGSFSFYVKTSFGETSIGYTVATLSFTPERLLMKSGETSTVEVFMEPVSNTDLILSLYNPQPQILEAPQEIVISRGTGTFQVTALSEGTVVLRLAGRGYSVWIAGTLTGDIYVDSGNVSVSMPLLVRNNTGILSSQVSVGMIFPKSNLMDSVSVQLMNTLGTQRTYFDHVSVQMPFEATKVSGGVCVEIE